MNIKCITRSLRTHWEMESKIGIIFNPETCLESNEISPALSGSTTVLAIYSTLKKKIRTSSIIQVK